MTCTDKLVAYLREAQVPFEMQHHPLAYTAQQVAQSEHIPGKIMTKVVVVFADGRPILLALPAALRVDLAKASKVLGAKVARLAHESELTTLFPDCEVGAMPPFGNLYDLPVFVDKALAEDDVIVFQAGTHTLTISLKYGDFARLTRPTVESFAEAPKALTAGAA